MTTVDYETYYGKANVLSVQFCIGLFTEFIGKFLNLYFIIRVLLYVCCCCIFIALLLPFNHISFYIAR